MGEHKFYCGSKTSWTVRGRERERELGNGGKDPLNMDGKRGFEDTALFSPMSWLRNRGREKKINFRLNQGAQSSPKRLRCSLQSSERALSSLGWKLLFPSSIGVSEHEEDRSAGDLCHPQNSESGCAWKSAGPHSGIYLVRVVFGIGRGLKRKVGHLSLILKRSFLLSLSSS